MSSHPESVTAVLTDNEPPDGTRLIFNRGDEWRIIVRDDRTAAHWGFKGTTRWFDGSDPGAGANTLQYCLKRADAVYALGEQLAVFRR